MMDITIPLAEDPQIALLLAVLSDVTREWREVSSDALVWQPAPDGHSIGAVLSTCRECRRLLALRCRDRRSAPVRPSGRRSSRAGRTSTRASGPYRRGTLCRGTTSSWMAFGSRRQKHGTL